ncbi:MAG: transposase [Candidatus Sericytochromatia bacterium]
MSRYSLERKVAVLDKLLPPHNLSIPEVANQEGISQGCLYNWLKQARSEGRPVPGSRKLTPEDWSSQDKFAVILETGSLNAQELSEYCRSKGLYPEQIERWKQAFIQGLDQAKPDPEAKETRKKIQKLEKEILRKDKALAEAAALLILQKKVQALWAEDAES